MVRKIKIVFPNYHPVEFDCPDKFHLARWFEERSLVDYEPLSQAFFLAAAEMRDGAVFDVGANIGIYAIACATALRKMVYAFEPFAEAAKVMRTAVAKNELPIYVHEAAVGENVGEASLFISNRSDMSNSLNPNFRENIEQRIVNSITIDSVSRKIKPCIIKIDTESTESAVLSGASKTLLRDRPLVLVEVLTKDLAKDVAKILHSSNYHWIELGNPSVQKKMGDLNGLDLSGDTRNWLAAPREFLFTSDFFESAKYWLKHMKYLS